MNENLRKIVSITLSHAERRSVSPKEIIQRLKSTFICSMIVVAKEKHDNETGYHYHVAVKNEDASRNTATRKIRGVFQEFEGMQCMVKFHKGIGNILAYITKEDKKPEVWGEYTLEQVLEMAETAKNHRKNETVPAKIIIEKIMKCDDWYEVYEEPILREKLLRAYNNMRRIHEDFQVIKKIKSTVGERLVEYLERKEWPREYSPEEILEKYVLLDWVACQLAFGRPIKTKQLFLYGEPSTQKTLIINFLARVLRIYFVSARRNDFAGADDYYDLWIFDEFNEPEEGDSFGAMAATEGGTAYANTLLRVLDGQECRLDAKYGKIFTKKKNVPIIMIANRLPKAVKGGGPMQERMIRLRFTTNIEDLEEERIVATLWGCIKRRLSRNIDLQRGNIIKGDMDIKYNEARVREKIEREGKEGKEIRRAMFVTKQKQEITARMWNLKYRDETYENEMWENYQMVEAIIREEQIEGDVLSFINFVIIPLKKMGVINNSEQKVEVFFDKKRGANFLIRRRSSLAEKDYMTWPIIAEDFARKRIITMNFILEGEEGGGEEHREIHTEDIIEELGEWKLGLGPSVKVRNGKKLWDEYD